MSDTIKLFDFDRLLNGFRAEFCEDVCSPCSEVFESSTKGNTWEQKEITVKITVSEQFPTGGASGALTPRLTLLGVSIRADHDLYFAADLVDLVEILVEDNAISFLRCVGVNLGVVETMF